MKILPTMASAMSGSLRGLTASHNKGGAYFRGRTIPVNPGSSSQMMVRGAFGSLSQIWSSTLTQAQRNSWDDYAAAVSWVDALGQTIQLSGINHFVRANTPRLQAMAELGSSLLMVDTAPPLNELGVAPTITAASLASTIGPPDQQTLDLVWDNTGSYVAGDMVLIYVAFGQNPGVKYFKGPYILSGEEDASVGNVSLVLADGVTAGAPYQERFGFVDPGMRVFGYARAAMLDGRLSQRVSFDAGLMPAAS